MTENMLNNDVFMICKNINRKAFTNLSQDYYTRILKQSELEIWKKLPYYEYGYTENDNENMTKWFKMLYGKNEEQFFKKCMVVCNKKDKIIGTGFLWKSYDNQINSVHWLKVIPEYENKGIGRALLSILFKEANKNDMPIYLHTQTGSFRAIKLYSDFGLKILTDKKIGQVNNNIKECREILKQYIPLEYYKKLKYTKAPKYFLKISEMYEHKEI